MSSSTATAILSDIGAALNLAPDVADRVSFGEGDRLSSCFPVSDLAVASIGAACAAIAEPCADGTKAPAVTVDYRLASLWFGWSIRPLGWDMPAAWDAIAGDYLAGDGWIKLHTNAPHHRAAVLKVLDCQGER